MARQPHLYGALRDDHKRALDALNTHIEQGKQPQHQALQVEPARAGPELTTGDIGGRSPGPNYSALREEHARSVEGPNSQIDQSRQSDQARQAEPGREGLEVATAGGGGRQPPDVGVADRGDAGRDAGQGPRHQPNHALGLGQSGGMAAQHRLIDVMRKQHEQQQKTLSAHVDQQRTPGDHGASPDRQGGRDGPQTDGPQAGRKPDRGPDMER